MGVGQESCQSRGLLLDLFWAVQKIFLDAHSLACYAAPMFSKEEVLSRLRKAKKSAGTQQALADQMGVSQVYLSDVLNGRREPGPAILAFLNLKAETVFKEDGKARAEKSKENQL